MDVLSSAGHLEAERAWLAGLPKVELHLHLEGAIPLDALWALIEKYGGDPQAPDRAALRRRFDYRDFPHFIDTWVWKNGFLRSYEDFAFIAESVARDLAAQHIVHAEVFFSPGDFARHGLGTQRLAEAIRAGLDRVPQVGVSLVADLVRDFGPVRGGRVLEEVAEVKDQGIVGIGIGGSEHEHPPEPYAAVYARARNLGFRTSAHAGEAAGAQSVWGAIRALEVDRIGHGTRAVEDPDLVNHLARARIPVELCPTSNLRTAVVPTLADHPARRYFEAGIPISVSSDDPKMFNTSVLDELLALRQHLGFTRPEILTVLRQTIDACWLDAPGRATLHSQLERAIRALPHHRP